MTNNVYIWEKPTDNDYEIAEVQIGNNGFNMSFVIDGTKDSAKIIVRSYTYREVFKPYSIVWHEDSDTWWVVSTDKVDRYINDDGTFVYEHTMQLEGLIELLNARDLTDCAFNQNKYTIDQIVRRLFKLSTFELPISINYNSNLSSATNVDYVKTYENYTLLNALRDLFDGYNCAIKMSFVKNTYYNIQGAIIKVISKTGDTSLTAINGDNYFKEVKETRQLNKNSYGTTVVSNAQNVVSTTAKTFPTCGTTKLTGRDATFIADDAVLRLPSNIFKVNWLRLCLQGSYRIRIVYNEINVFVGDYYYVNGNNIYNNRQFDKLCDDVYDYFTSLGDKQWLIDQLRSLKSNMFETLDKATRITLYNCENWNPYDKNFVAPTNIDDFYFPSWYRELTPGSPYTKQLVLCPKEVKDACEEIQKRYFTVGWERGKDYIEDFRILANTYGSNKAYPTSYLSTDLRSSGSFASWDLIHYNDSFTIEFSGATLSNSNNTIANTSFIVNYTPMSDLKIKYDNFGDSKNIQLYNQNGKLTDSNGFSKLICSYKKEIESENITRYNINYSLTSHLQVGQIVYLYDTTYIVNSVSLDLYQNENKTYFVVEEYTLSKDIAVKSLMTNPNTNVRDYGIPQNYNVKRKQLYRDFYELGYQNDGDNDIYLPLSKVMNLSTTPTKYNEHIAVIKVNYAIDTGGDDNNSIAPKRTWYYQLNTTTYVLKKSIYEVVDFKDNNIIGYSALNMFSGFDISKLLTGMNQMMNTPVQYVDDNGELKDIYVAYCTADQLQTIYEAYIDENNLSLTTPLYNASAFIDEKIYEGSSGLYDGAKDSNDFLISETNYYKDALEVPVFEYSCQIDDSEYVLIGENILDQELASFFLYSFVLVPKNVYTENNAYSLSLPSIDPYIIQFPYATYKSNNVVSMNYNTINGKEVIEIRLYEDATFRLTTQTLGSQINLLDDIDLENNDLVIFRRALFPLNSSVLKTDVMFIIRNMSEMISYGSIDDDCIQLMANHFKIK